MILCLSGRLTSRVGHMLLYLLLIFWVVISCTSLNKNSESPVPAASQQMIVVISESFESSAARLYRYQRERDDDSWMLYAETITAIVGKKGMGWGRGLHTKEPLNGPVKREGDGKSPAGVFTLSTAFGFVEPQEMTALKMPYLHIREMVECVDDPNSVHYNSIVDREQVEEVDWQSSERMWRARTWYDQGVFVDHNYDPSEKGAGSCIFLHNWANPQDSTSGCTALDPWNMKDIIIWLDVSKFPVLVQLPEPVYAQLKVDWGLPDLPTDKPGQLKNEKPNMDNSSNRAAAIPQILKFRAVGNEPGWILELSAGDSISFVTDYGRNSYRFKTPRPDIDSESGQTVYRIDQEGRTFMLIIEAQPCRDSMSGQTFESQVTVIINGQKWMGCGKTLHE